MKKALIILAVCGMVASFATVANAQVNGRESVYFFDIRDNVTAGVLGSGGQLITSPKRPFTSTLGDGDPVGTLPADLAGGLINAGGRGAGQILRLSPTQLNNIQSNTVIAGTDAYPNFDFDGLMNTGNLWLYGVVEDDEDGVAGVNDVISSLGINLDLAVLLAARRNPISTINFQLFNNSGGIPPEPGVVGPVNGSPWNNKINGAIVAGDPPQWAGAKAARVPVATGPVYQQSLGLSPGPGAGPGTLYRLGVLRVTAGARNCTGTATTQTHAKKSSYSVHIRNNNILTTRVYQSGGDPLGSEAVAYGYTTAFTAGELANTSGSVENAKSTAADGIIQIRLKGDFDGNGVVDGNDVPPFLAAALPGVNLSNAQCYLGDWATSTGPVHDKVIDGFDVPGFLAQAVLAGTCP